MADENFVRFRRQFPHEIMPDDVRVQLGELLRQVSEVVGEDHLAAAFELAGLKRTGFKGVVHHMRRGGDAKDDAYWIYYFWLHTTDPTLSLLARIDRALKREIPATEVNPTHDSTSFRSILTISQFFNLERYNNDVHHTSQALKVLGRHDEQQKLRDFLAADRVFCWLQLAGVGGQGKSRLAFDLVQEAEAKDWDAGFLTAQGLNEFKDRWAEWQPDKPTLVVIDYVMGRERLIASAFSHLVKRDQNFAKPVRLLLLERQRFDRGVLRHPTTNADQQSRDFLPASLGKAQWFLELCEASPFAPEFSPDIKQVADARFGDGVIELEQLKPDELFSIVQQVVQKNDKSVVLPEREIKDVLARIDNSGRPLFAYLLGHELAACAFQPSWTREQLLTSYLERGQKTRWEKAFGTDGRACPSLDDGTPPIQLARLATIVGGYDNLAAKEILRETGWTEPDIATLKEALILVDGAAGSGGPFAGYVPPLQPDLLGEWFVLWAVTSGTIDTTQFMKTAWALDMFNTSAFLQRCAQDFPPTPSGKQAL